MFSPIEFSFKRSRSLIILILGSHLLSLYCLYVAALDVTIASVLSFIVMLSLGWNLRRDVVNNINGIIGIRFNGARKQISVNCHGRWCPVDKVVSAVVLPYAVVLGFRVEGSRFTRYVVVFFDALSRDDFRRLRVFAVHGAYVKDPETECVAD